MRLGTGADPTKRRLGLVTQEIALLEELPARMNLEFFGGLYGLSGNALAARIAAVLELTSLADRAGDPPSEFSGGMRRRLNIACALLHEPQILLLDEPTVGVDPQSRNAIFDTIEVLAGEGRTLVYTTHYMEEVEKLCDRIVIVDHGRVLANDTLAGLLASAPVANRLMLKYDPRRMNLRSLKSAAYPASRRSFWLKANCRCRRPTWARRRRGCSNGWRRAASAARNSQAAAPISRMCSSR